MAYQGYLFRVGGFVVTGENYINYESYKAVIEVQDLDPTRTANGDLIRNALPHTVLHVTFSTRENLNSEDFGTFMRNIRNNFTIALERKANIMAYVPELNDYVTQACYMPTPNPEIKVIDPNTNTIRYKSMELEFIGY